MISSIRFKNSGLNAFFSAASTDALMPSFSDLDFFAVAKPNGSFAMSSVPRLLVMMTTVLRKSTVRPWPSVSRPSSRSWSRVLNTSGWAFSISSNRTTWNGRLRTASVSPPPSPYPTYPGGAPISLETVCRSCNSDMSIRTMFSSSSKRNSASAFASSVFPTPVGPRNMKLPMGRPGSESPARALRTASASAPIAVSWPITRSCKRSSILSSRSASPSTSCALGMPVRSDICSAMCRSVTTVSALCSEDHAASAASHSSASRMRSARCLAAASWSSRWEAAASSSFSR